MIWKSCKLAALFVLATICHWGFATLFSYVDLNVNMMLVFAIAFCTIAKLEISYPFVFLCGLFLDFFGIKLFGNNAFLFTLVACTVIFLRERIDFSAVIPQVITVFLLSCAVGFLNSVLLFWFTSSALWPGLWSLVGGALVGALLSPAVFWLIRQTWKTPLKQEYE